MKQDTVADYVKRNQLNPELAERIRQLVTEHCRTFLVPQRSWQFLSELECRKRSVMELHAPKTGPGPKVLLDNVGRGSIIYTLARLALGSSIALTWL